MCRGLSMNRSIKTAPLPNAASASLETCTGTINTQNVKIQLNLRKLKLHVAYICT